MSADGFLSLLSRSTYAPLIGWAAEEAPAELEDHLSLLKKEAPAILFLGNLAGCLGIQLLSLLRFGKSLSHVDPAKLDPWLARLGSGPLYPLRLALMVLKSHALMAAYRAPAPIMSPALFHRRPPWTDHPSI